MKKFSLLVLGLMVGGWSFGLLSGFRPSYPKEIFFLWVMSLTAILIYNLKVSSNDFIKLFFLLILAIPGIIPAESHPRVLFYLFSIVITFILIINKEDRTQKLNPWILGVYFVSLIAGALIYKTTGALYIFGIQPSISDLFFLSVFIYIWCESSGASPSYNKSLLVMAIVFCFFYGLLMNSRVMLASPFLMFFLGYIHSRFPKTFRVFFYAGTVLICTFGFGGKYFIPEALFSLKGQISELGEVAGIEAKRFSLLLNGWDVLDKSNYMGVGFGPGAYLPHTTDNPLGIGPQFLPLSLAAYSGVLFSSYFVLTFARWVIRPTGSANTAGRVIVFFFILVHEYVFNPIFWVVLIINSAVGGNRR